MSERAYFSYPYRTREEFQRAFLDLERHDTRMDPDGSARRNQAAAWVRDIDATIFAKILIAQACGDPPFRRPLFLPRYPSAV